MDLKEDEVWSVFSWLRIGTGDGCLLTW